MPTLKDKLAHVSSKLTSRNNLLLFWGLFVVTVLYRVILFNAVPYGMNQDEINAGYESWSLLHFGTDHWGNRWPVYFPSWGSGQNVLYSYILIPFMAVLGDSNLVIRIPALLMGIALPVIIYALVKRWYPTKVALTAMFISAIFPDFIRASRWAVESNIVPFMVALSLYVLTLALQKPKPWLIVISLIPLALTIYAYVITLVPIAIFLLSVLIWKHKTIIKNWISWCLASVTFIICIIPILLFLLKNYLFNHTPFSFEHHLPFSLPNLSDSRYEQVRAGESLFEVFRDNLVHLILGDWVGQTGSGPLWVFPIFIFVAITLLARLNKTVKKLLPLNLIIIWCLSALTLVVFVPLSNIRGNLLFVPFIIILSAGVYLFLKHAPISRPKVWAILLIIVYTIYTNVWFAGYLTQQSPHFNGDFEQAVTAAAEQAQGEPIYISKTSGLQLDYMQVMWYQRMTPQLISQNPEPIAQLQNFVFNDPVTFDGGESKRPYYEILSKQSIKVKMIKPCSDGQNVYDGKQWVVYKCQ